MQTWHLHITGQVQGVGFRPYVYRMAHENGLKGWVNNTTDGVHVEFNAEEDAARKFSKDIVRNKPVLSRITGWNLTKTVSHSYQDFSIIHSQFSDQASLLMTPDFALCSECKTELHDPLNRRFLYPFTSCTNCGPRYSIIRDLPYDRDTTTMDSFEMCPECEKEYADPEDRRYYSQTNSCASCRISLQWYESDGKLSGGKQIDIISKCVEAWEEGKIVAIKGIGGYLLTCDASNENAIRLLRERKYRPSKPFALMYPSLEKLSEDAELSDNEIAELTGPAAPILLLDLKPGASVAAGIIAPGINRIGAMLPYAPLFELLLSELGRAVVATSGNISNSPIVFQDKQALADLSLLADHILANDRDIVIPQDDSVIRYCSVNQQRIVIRRSRGIAPTYINAGLNFQEQIVFAAGAMLKSTFTFIQRGNCYISQYLGDTDSFDTQQAYRLTRDHFFRLFHEKPSLILADKHPQYFSSLESENLAKTTGAKLIKYQHHIAHFAAVLGENCLMKSDEKILGVIWDGTGYGADGQVWGGEFFLFDKSSINRCGHLEYFQSILGDKMALEPRISLLSCGKGSAGIREKAKAKFNETEWSIYSALLEKDGLKTSSMGRLFDAVASLLGLCDRSTYEGEAAMYLEGLAAAAYHSGSGINEAYKFTVDADGKIHFLEMLDMMCADLSAGIPPEIVALKFHRSLVRLIADFAKRENCRSIGFSGGVFQNSLLVDLICDALKEDFQLYFHKELSPNDECISFGQLMCYSYGLDEGTGNGE